MATNFTEGYIREISVAGSPWCPDEIEITLVFDGLVCKNNYTPYVPERHGRLFAGIAVKEKLEILRQEASSIIDCINSAVQPTVMIFHSSPRNGTGFVDENSR